MWQNAKWNSPALHSKIGPAKEHARGAMACPSRVWRAWVTAVMFIGRLRWQSGGDGSALFRQELGLSSDSKIWLIYDISTPGFPLDPLSPSPQNLPHHHPRSTPPCWLLTFREGCLFTSYFHQKDQFSFLFSVTEWCCLMMACVLRYLKTIFGTSKVPILRWKKYIFTATCDSVKNFRVIYYLRIPITQYCLNSFQRALGRFK